MSYSSTYFALLNLRSETFHKVRRDPKIHFGPIVWWNTPANPNGPSVHVYCRLKTNWGNGLPLSIRQKVLFVVRKETLTYSKPQLPARSSPALYDALFPGVKSALFGWHPSLSANLLVYRPFPRAPQVTCSFFSNLTFLFCPPFPDLKVR